jgi:hypothetical protein
MGACGFASKTVGKDGGLAVPVTGYSNRPAEQPKTEIPHLFVTLPSTKPGYISPICGFAVFSGL